MSYSSNNFTPEKFGARGDGITDDTAAFIAMFAAMAAALLVGHAQPAVLAEKTYLVQSGLRPPAGASIFGQGAASVLKMTNNAAFPTECLSIRQNDILLQNFKLLGNNGNLQMGLALGTHGVVGSGPQRFKAFGLIIDSFGYANVQHAQSPTTVNLHEGPQFVACSSLNSGGFGWLFTEGGEYATLSACVSHNNLVGFYADSGNIEWSGGFINNNVTGVRLVGGANNSHGIFSGAQINHNNGTNIDVGAITNGASFIGCHVYGSSPTSPNAIIKIASNPSTVDFIGCEIDETGYTFDGCLARFIGCLFPMGDPNAVTEANNPDVEFLNNRDLAGGIPAFIGSRMRMPVVFAGDANQALTKQQSRAQMIIVADGTITVPRLLTSTRAPQLGAWIQVANNNHIDITFAWSAGAAVTIPAGQIIEVGSDGVNATIDGPFAIAADPYFAGAAILRGQMCKLLTTTAGSVIPCAAGDADFNAIGPAQAGAALNATVYLMRIGQKVSVLSDGAGVIAIGDRITLSGASAGRVKKDAVATDAQVGIAMTGAAAVADTIFTMMYIPGNAGVT